MQCKEVFYSDTDFFLMRITVFIVIYVGDNVLKLYCIYT